MQTEVNYIIEKLPEQIEMHSRMSYEATNKPKFEAIKKKLLSNDGSILMEFLAALDARELDFVCKPLLRVLGKKLEVENMLQKLIFQEVERAKEASTLFRTDSPVTKLVTAFTREVASSYLVNTLGGIIRSVLQGPVLDLTDSVGQVASQQVQNLASICNQIIQSLVETKDHMPLPVRRLVSAFQAAVGKKFPQSKCIVSAYLFFKVINPFIANPDKFGVCQRPIEHRDRRNLSLLERVLQKLANGTTFRDNDCMKLMNPFLEGAALNQMQDYMNELGHGGLAPDNSRAGDDFSSTIEDQMHLHRMLLQKRQSMPHASALLLDDLQPPLPQNDSSDEPMIPEFSLMFHVKDHSPMSPDDHFLTLLGVCKNTVLNFYVPMQNHLLECLEARRRAQEHIKFNVREIQQCVVNVQKADFFGRHLGPMCRPSKLVEQNTPTHVRFISHEVQAGLFRVAQPQSVFDFPLNRTGHGMAQLPDKIVNHSSPKKPQRPFYSGSQHSWLFPCDERRLTGSLTVVLLKEEELPIEGGGVATAMREIETFEFGPKNPETRTACKEDGKIQIKVALFFNNWLCHEFPAMQPEPEACWYFQDDKKFELHACHPSTVEQLERHYKQNEGRDIQHHKFEMDAPFLIKFEGKLVQSTWIFEAVSVSPTYVMVQINSKTRSQRLIVRVLFQSTHKNPASKH